ncbi:hypothetical protein BDAP_000860 [Binucleata daphniae]
MVYLSLLILVIYVKQVLANIGTPTDIALETAMKEQSDEDIANPVPTNDVSILENEPLIELMENKEIAKMNSLNEDIIQKQNLKQQIHEPIKAYQFICIVKSKKDIEKEDKNKEKELKEKETNEKETKEKDVDDTKEKDVDDTKKHSGTENTDKPKDKTEVTDNKTKENIDDLYIEVKTNTKKSKINAKKFEKIMNDTLEILNSVHVVGFFSVSFGVKPAQEQTKIPEELKILRLNDQFTITYTDENLLTITKNNTKLFADYVSAESAEKLRKDIEKNLEVLE